MTPKDGIFQNSRWKSPRQILAANTNCREDAPANPYCHRSSHPHNIVTSSHHHIIMPAFGHPSSSQVSGSQAWAKTTIINGTRSVTVSGHPCRNLWELFARVERNSPLIVPTTW
jgi:hypothetical protein